MGMGIELLAFLLLGSCSGLLAGLLGVGGGLIIVPGLIFLLPATGQEPQHLAHLAVGTSLAAIIPTSISSTRAHHRRGSVEWGLLPRLAPGLLLGGLFGAWLATQLGNRPLQTVFALFLLGVSVQMLRGGRPRPAEQRMPAWMPLTVGGLIGSVSGVVGIGGGTMTVPFLVWRGRDIRRAIGTSAACGIPIAIGGAIGFVVLGPEQALPGSLGSVHWPAALAIGLMGILAAPQGARLAHWLPVVQVRRIFVLLLVLVALRLLWPVS